MGEAWHASENAGRSGHRARTGRTRASLGSSVSGNTGRGFLLRVLAASTTSVSKRPLPGEEKTVSPLRSGFSSGPVSHEHRAEARSRTGPGTTHLSERSGKLSERGKWPSTATACLPSCRSHTLQLKVDCSFSIVW